MYRHSHFAHGIFSQSTSISFNSPFFSFLTIFRKSIFPHYIIFAFYATINLACAFRFFCVKDIPAFSAFSPSYYGFTILSAIYYSRFRATYRASHLYFTSTISFSSFLLISPRSAALWCSSQSVIRLSSSSRLS